MKFTNRVFGCAVVKAINSNYNADFTGQPRTLPDGTVYATDKVFKYTIKNLIKNQYPHQTVFYFKSLNKNMNPISLDETYVKYFNKYPEDKKAMKQEVAKNLLSCIDVRLFGATFAGKTNISIHGPVQINHGVNIWHENNIYSEQITAPFSNKSNDVDAERGMTTIGRQSKLQEGHYVHHFSINPSNINTICELTSGDVDGISDADIKILKYAMRHGATFYDSASKAGTDNELLLWVQLNEDSKLILPNFTELIRAKTEKENGMLVYDFAKVTELLNKYPPEIESIELYYNKQTVKTENLPLGTNELDIFSVE